MVLVVEDDPAILECITIMLEAEGLEVIGADNGRAAIELSQRFVPELVVSDLNMPGVDGFGVLQEVRRNPQTASVPVMMVTADSSAGVRQRCLQHGANAFLSKPFVPEELVETIYRLLRREPVHASS